MHRRTKQNFKSYTAVGLFSGIGGMEVGFHRAGHRTTLMCDVDSAAQAVLAQHFSDVFLVSDVRELRTLGGAQVICAGFPCQDLSQAGKTAGINGSRSSVIAELFRLLDCSETPEWIFLENVPFMLHLGRGAAMQYLTGEFEKRGYTWAYRIVDSRGFGLPQRRRRVFILASKTNDPRPPLLNQDCGRPVSEAECNAFGFYWTEGNTGLGWAEDAVPTLKGGSGLGIPSPPAIWIRNRGIFLPDIRDAERLQGFDSNWTLTTSPTGNGHLGVRWKLVGNAISVPVAEWVGNRLFTKEAYDNTGERVFSEGDRWPNAAWGERGRRFEVERTAWPIPESKPGLLEFLRYPLIPLSANATAGFLSRARASRLKFVNGFLKEVAVHLEAMQSRKPKHAGN